MKPRLQAVEGGKTDHPEKDPLKPHIESRKDGVFWVTPKVDKESGEIINAESWLCSPLEVIGTGRDDKDQYLIISWLPFGAGIPTTAAIPLADIGEREGWRTLKAGGVNVTTKTAYGRFLPTGYSGAARVNCGALLMLQAGSAGHTSCRTGKSSAHLSGLFCSAGAVQPLPGIP